MSRIAALLCVILLLTSSGCNSSSPEATRTEVQQLVRDYVDANNKPDVTAMMELVSRTDGVSMAINGNVARGWDAIRTFNDGATAASSGSFQMALGSIDVRPLGGSAALVVAPVTLTIGGANGDESLQRTGALSMVLEKADKGWKIVHQHMSLEPEQVEGD